MRENDENCVCDSVERRIIIDLIEGVADGLSEKAQVVLNRELISLHPYCISENFVCDQTAKWLVVTDVFESDDVIRVSIRFSDFSEIKNFAAYLEYQGRKATLVENKLVFEWRKE